MRLWLSCIVLALVAPALAAAPPVLRSSSLHSAGDVETALEASLVFQRGDSASSPRLDPAFLLSAPSGRLELQQTTTTVRLEAATVPVQPTTSVTPLSAFTLRGNDARPFYDLTVVATGSHFHVTTQTACTNLEPNPQPDWQRDAYLAARAPIVTSGTLRWTFCDEQATLTIHGDMELALWEVDGTLDAGDASRTLTTGWGAMPLPVGTSSSAQAFVYATNATLRLPVQQSPNLLILTDQANTQTHGTVTLFHASLAGTGLAADQAQVRGDSLLRTREEANQLSSVVDGTGQLNMAGQTIALQDPVSAAWSPWMFAGLLLLGLVALVALRRLLGRVLMRKADDLLGRDHPAAAAFMAVAASWLSPTADGQLLAGRIQIRRRRSKAALRHLAKAYRGFQDPADLAVTAYLTAVASAQLYQGRAATHWLGLALRSDQSLVADAVDEPAFSNLAGFPEFRRLIGTAVHAHADE